MSNCGDSFSFLSTLPDVETIYTPSETDQSTDDFEILSHEEEQVSRGDLASSCSTSVLPSAYEHEFAHGRRYHGYKRGRYPLPNDIAEQQREDIVHAMMLELTNGRLFLADVGDFPQKIIDVGTGTGTWAIDDVYPSASVIGTDLSPIQPTWLPINVRMFVEDCEEPEWLHGPCFDLVHFRGMASTLHDVGGMLAKVYPHIREDGWVEFQELMPQILCDDGTMSADDPLKEFIDLCTQGMHVFGGRTQGYQDLRAALESAGFKDVQCIVKKVPISTWPRDKQLRTVGMFMKAAILESLGAMAAKPLAALDLPLEKRQKLMARAKESLQNGRSHRYVECCFCYGRKDGS